MSKVNTVTLGEIAEFKNGLNFRANESGFPIKVLGVGDFQKFTRFDQVKNLTTIHTDKEVNESYHLKNGDIVFVRSNGNKELVGRSLLVYTYGEPVSFSGFTIRARLLNKSIKPEYVSLLMQAGLLKATLKREGAGTNISNLNQDILAKLPILMISIIAQEKLLDYMSSWDNVIETTERLIEVKERYVDGFSSKLIHNPLFSKIHVHQIASEFSIRNKDNCIRVLSVTNKNGFVLPEDRFERRVASENVSNYKLVQKGQYAYNPSRINVGSIARLDEWDEGILSPMYTIFEIDESQVNSDFFLHWLSSYNAKQRIKKSAQGSVRETVSFGDFGAIPIPFPSIDDQRKIAEILNTAKREIDLLKRLAASYRVQKRGLMQKLLSGEWRVAG